MRRGNVKRKEKAMAGQNGHAGVTNKSSTSGSAKSLVTRKRNFSEIIKWEAQDCLGEFHDLVEDPPLHSEPRVARHPQRKFDTHAQRSLGIR